MVLGMRQYKKNWHAQFINSNVTRVLKMRLRELLTIFANHLSNIDYLETLIGPARPRPSTLGPDKEGRGFFCDINGNISKTVSTLFDLVKVRGVRGFNGFRNIPLSFGFDWAKSFFLYLAQPVNVLPVPIRNAKTILTFRKLWLLCSVVCRAVSGHFVVLCVGLFLKTL